jgi:ribosomal protein S18 acetylase RimI-like enzyme
VNDFPAEVHSWSGAQFADRIDDAMRVYARAMDYPPSAGDQRAMTARHHVDYDGFCARAATLPDGTLVGFGYGYTTMPGQWWHDLVRTALSGELARDWLRDAFELSELHVLPEYQCRGLGRRMLVELAEAVPHAAMLLSTPDIETRAFRLYREYGFRDLRRRYLFPGDVRPFAILGASLPLAAPPGRPSGHRGQRGQRRAESDPCGQ